MSVQAKKPKNPRAINQVTSILKLFSMEKNTDVLLSQTWPISYLKNYKGQIAFMRVEKRTEGSITFTYMIAPTKYYNILYSAVLLDTRRGWKLLGQVKEKTVQSMGDLIENLTLPADFLYINEHLLKKLPTHTYSCSLVMVRDITKELKESKKAKKVKDIKGPASLDAHVDRAAVYSSSARAGYGGTSMGQFVLTEKEHISRYVTDKLLTVEYKWFFYVDGTSIIQFESSLTPENVHTLFPDTKRLDSFSNNMKQPVLNVSNNVLKGKSNEELNAFLKEHKFDLPHFVSTYGCSVSEPRCYFVKLSEDFSAPIEELIDRVTVMKAARFLKRIT